MSEHVLDISRIFIYNSNETVSKFADMCYIVLYIIVHFAV